MCKNVYRKGLARSLVIFRWKLERGTGDRLSRLVVPLERVIGSNPWKGLHPSDITVDPRSGNYVLVAAREKALVVLTPRGGVLAARPLPGKHEQAEGVAVTELSLHLPSLDEVFFTLTGHAADETEQS